MRLRSRYESDRWKWMHTTPPPGAGTGVRYEWNVQLAGGVLVVDRTVSLFEITERFVKSRWSDGFRYDEGSGETEPSVRRGRGSAVYTLGSFEVARVRWSSPKIGRASCRERVSLLVGSEG